MEMSQAATPQLKVFSSFAALSCSWQFVIVLAMLEFQCIAFKQRARPVLLVENHEESSHWQCCGAAAQSIIHHSSLVRRVLDIVEVLVVLVFPTPTLAVLLRSKKRGKSVSDGFCRASFCVFVDPLLAVLRRSRYTQFTHLFHFFQPKSAKWKFFFHLAFSTHFPTFWPRFLKFANFK